MPSPRQPLPRCRQSAEDRLLNRFDFSAKLRERSPANLAEDSRVRPLASRATGTEFAFDHSSLSNQASQQLFSICGIEAKSRGEIARIEWRVSPGESKREIALRIAHGIEDRLRQVA